MKKTAENRLAKEKSPYLLQHARNPVDWYPWGQEAFERARQDNKLIFLSIGYSTCHWCHVMEHESFENPGVAALLNQDFVPIKVDREERPDIDHIYMTAVQALTGSGGWPLLVFLTPEGKPVTGGTYFPPEDKWGRPGMKTILPRLSKFWKEQQAEMKDAANQITDLLHPKDQSAEIASYETLSENAARQFQNSFDADHGGFGGAPKFPRTHDLCFLLRRWKRTQNPAELEMVEKTLIHMATGGIYDHLGGGFHRYATDANWLVPHFEKMLYDQALLVRTYLEAYQATRRPFYGEVAKDIVRYVLRDMTSPEGAFFSAEDADSEGEEGKFYVWRPEEIKKILGSEDGEIFCGYFGVTEERNFEHASSILNLPAEAGFKTPPANLKEMRQKLFDVRKKRIPPYKDDKILTSWNGLMISALAYGSQVLDEPSWAAHAARAAEFILKKMREKGQLLRRFREGESAIPAFQEDYSYFAMGLLDLYEATFDPRWKEESLRLAGIMKKSFWDSQSGGFFYTAEDGEKLIARTKDYYDGATPSGNSTAALLMLRLSRVTEESDWEKDAEKTIRSNAAAVQQYPAAFPLLLNAIDFILGPSREIVLAGDLKNNFFRDALRLLHAQYEPNRTFAWRDSHEKPAVYVCRNRVCDLPATDLKTLESVLKK